MTEQTEQKETIRQHAMITDDEEAVNNCRSLRAIRQAKRLSQVIFGARIGLSGAGIGRIEHDPEHVTVKTYNSLALCLGWSAYQPGRISQHGTFVPCEEQTSPTALNGPLSPVLAKGSVGMESEREVKEQKRETITFMDELFSVSPDEGFDAWFDSLDAKVKSSMNSLSDLLSISPSELAFYALREFTSKREALL